jgi:AraC-like DNA-binding protein
MDTKPLVSTNSEIDAHFCCFKTGASVVSKLWHTGNDLAKPFDRSAVEREELLILRMNTTGGLKGVLGGQSFQSGPSDLLLCDVHQEMNFRSNPGAFVNFTFRYSDIGYDPSRDKSLLQVSANSPIGQLLTNNLNLLLDLVPTASREDARTLGDGFTALIAGLLSREMTDETSYRRFLYARETSIRRFVENNLRDENLSADMICASLGVSRPVLFRIYEAEGGVMRAVVKMRLEKAFRDLADSELGKGVVSRIARRWCFSDPAYFTRLFRKTYGAKPSDVVGSSLLSNSKTDGTLPKTGKSQVKVANWCSLFEYSVPEQEDQPSEKMTA